MPRRPRRLALCALVAPLLLLAAACGSDDGGGGGGGTTATGDERPTIVATTSVLGDVVEGLVGDQAEVEVLIGAGADPHDAQLSARQAAELREADAIVSNGADFEAGILGALESAEADGVAHHRAIDGVDVLAPGEGGHGHAHEDEEGDADEDGHAHEEDAHDGEDDHDGEDGHGHGEEGEDHAHEDEHGHGEEDAHEDEHGHGEEDAHEEEDAHDAHDADGPSDPGAADDDHGHDHGDVDPHFFTDPARMADAARGIVDFLVAEVPALDSDAFRDGAAAYVDRLEHLDAEVEEILAPLEADQRVLVTNHEVFGYFADRYAFEVIGVVIRGGGTDAQPSARDLSELADLVEAEGVPAIFVDVSSPRSFADTVAAEVGGVEVVGLFTEALGDEGSGGDTYEAMVRTNAERIVAALG